MHQFDTISLDVNELPTHILVQFQKTASQKLTNMEEIIGNHLVKLQEQEALTKEEIEHPKKAQEVEIMAKC